MIGLLLIGGVGRVVELLCVVFEKDYDLVGNNLGGCWVDLFGGLVFDVIGIIELVGFKGLYEFFILVLCNFGCCGCVVVVGGIFEVVVSMNEWIV